MQTTDYFSKETSNTLYVKGIPIDASEREISRKFLFCLNSTFVDIFRACEGYVATRLVEREGQGKKFKLCFVEFVNSSYANLALQMKQGFVDVSYKIQGML